MRRAAEQITVSGRYAVVAQPAADFRGVAAPALGQRPVPVGHVRPVGFGVPEQDQPPGHVAAVRWLSPLARTGSLRVTISGAARAALRVAGPAARGNPAEASRPSRSARRRRDGSRHVDPAARQRYAWWVRDPAGPSTDSSRSARQTRPISIGWPSRPASSARRSSVEPCSAPPGRGGRDSSTGRRRRRRPARNRRRRACPPDRATHEVDRWPHHRPAELAASIGLDAAVRLLGAGSRPPDTERIAGRPVPAERSRPRCPARLRGQVVLHEQAHHEGGGMPAAGDQAAVRAGRRGHRIDVERLRIEFFGESNDASLVDADAAALVCGPEQVVLEVAQPVIVHSRSIAAPVTCELIDHR